MFDIIFQDHIRTIKRISGAVGLILCIITIIFNVIDYRMNELAIINITLCVVLIILLLLTMLINEVWTLYLQAAIFISTGIIGIIFSSEYYYFVGDLIYIVGLFYLYIYRIIKKFDKKVFIPFVLIAIAVRIGTGFFSQRQSVWVEALSVIFIIIILSLIIYIFQNQITWYTLQSYKNEKMNRVGMNAHNLIHEQDFDHIESGLKDIMLLIDRKNYDVAKKLLQVKIDMVAEHNRLRRIFLKSYDEDDGLAETTIDINMELEALTRFEYLNHDRENRFYLERITAFCKEPLQIIGNRYEITGIFQNIISNAIDAMKKHPDIVSHKLIIQTRSENDKAIITISDTGKGFPGADKQGRVKLESIKTSKETGGFGFVHIKYFVHQYKGSMEVHNNPEGGASIKITLPVLKIIKKSEETEDEQAEEKEA